MARPEWRDGEKERYWRGVMEEWRQSGLTARAFCGQRGLAEHNFFAWRRTLAEREASVSASVQQDPQSGVVPCAQPAIKSTSKRRRRRRKPRFVPVQIVSNPAAIEIVLPRGLSVRVASGADGATLREVLAAISAADAGDPSC